LNQNHFFLMGRRKKLSKKGDQQTRSIGCFQRRTAQGGEEKRREARKRILFCAKEEQGLRT